MVNDPNLFVEKPKGDVLKQEDINIELPTAEEISEKFGVGFQEHIDTNEIRGLRRILEFVGFDIIQFSKDMSTASASETISHSLGRRPSLIIFFAGSDTNQGNISLGAWRSFGQTTENLCIYTAGTGGRANKIASAIYVDEGSSDTYEGEINTRPTTTDFIIEWTRGLGNPTNTIEVLAILL